MRMNGHLAAAALLAAITLGCSSPSSSDVDSGSNGADASADAVPDVQPADSSADVLPDSSGSDGPVGPDGIGPVDDKLPLPNTLVGTIRAIEEPPWDGGDKPNSRVEIELWSGLNPNVVSQKVVAEEGECVLLVGPQTMPFACQPECDPSTLCVDGECVPYPSHLSAGTITVDGLAQKVTIPPGDQNYYAGTFLESTDLFTPGAAIHATSTGADLPPLNLLAGGVPELDGDFDALQIEKGKSITFTWKPAADNPPGGRVFVQLMTGWHGSPNLTTIWCDSPDDGQILVPKSMVDQFPSVSCGECELSYAGRMTVDTVEVEGGVIALQVITRHGFVAWW